MFDVGRCGHADADMPCASHSDPVCLLGVTSRTVQTTHAQDAILHRNEMYAVVRALQTRVVCVAFTQQLDAGARAYVCKDRQVPGDKVHAFCSPAA